MLYAYVYACIPVTKSTNHTSNSHRRVADKDEILNVEEISIQLVESCEVHVVHNTTLGLCRGEGKYIEGIVDSPVLRKGNVTITEKVNMGLSCKIVYENGVTGTLQRAE